MVPASQKLSFSVSTPIYSLKQALTRGGSVSLPVEVCRCQAYLPCGVFAKNKLLEVMSSAPQNHRVSVMVLRPQLVKLPCLANQRDEMRDELRTLCIMCILFVHMYALSYNICVSAGPTEDRRGTS